MPTSLRRAGELAAPLLPILCAIHCLAMPLVVTALPAVEVGEILEPWLIAGTALLALALTMRGRRRHGSAWPSRFVAAAIVTWGLAALDLTTAITTEHTTPLGHALVAVGLLLNVWLSHRRPLGRTAAA